MIGSEAKERISRKSGFPNADMRACKTDDTAAISVINRALVGSCGCRACMLAKLLEVW